MEKNSNTTPYVYIYHLYTNFRRQELKPIGVRVSKTQFSDFKMAITS